MNDTRPTHTQDLREAFASIISMMLGVLRAQGWRGLLHLPEIVMVVFLLRSISKRFAALMDSLAKVHAEHPALRAVIVGDLIELHDSLPVASAAHPSLRWAPKS